MTGSSVVDTENWRQFSVNVDNSGSSSRTHGLGLLGLGVSGSSSDFSNISSAHIYKWFWKLVRDLSESDKGLLLRFCTGCSRVPTGGFQQMKPAFTINITPYSPLSSLPTASTCFNLLKLPRYPTEQMLRKNVSVAISFGSEGFSFS